MGFRIFFVVRKSVRSAFGTWLKGGFSVNVENNHLLQSNYRRIMCHRTSAKKENARINLFRARLAHNILKGLYGKLLRNYYIFMPPLRSSRRHYVFGLSVRPYVRTSRSRDRVIWRTDWWIPAKLWSCMYLAEPMNWLDFGVTRSKVKGHRAHYVCKNSSWSRYLKNRLMDSCQTLVMYVSCRADELIRFWGQRSCGSLCMQK